MLVAEIRNVACEEWHKSCQRKLCNFSLKNMHVFSESEFAKPFHTWWKRRKIKFYVEFLQDSIQSFSSPTPVA